MSIEKRGHLSEFQRLMADEKKARKLLEGSCIFIKQGEKDAAWKKWETGRRFIASTINKSGTILDYGCANGFLLRSLQEWSAHKLDPYGCDIDEAALAKAKDLFPDQRDHFFCPEEYQSDKQLPEQFDFVYWNVWDDFTFKKTGERELLQKLNSVTAEQGRLILGLYDTKEKNLKKIETLKQRGFQPTSVIENPHGNETIVVFDKSITEKNQR